MATVTDQTAFTPGSWEYTLFESDHGDHHAFVRAGGDGQPMFVANTSGPDFAANARLIASAPDLCEAAKPLAHYADINDLQDRDPDDSIEVPVRDLLAIRAAFLRATSPKE